jgi:hypothetical protein
MDSFLQQHSSSVTGTLSGWDRIRFRGILRLMASSSGLSQFLSMVGCKFKDFKHYALGVSKQVREASVAVAESAQRPVQPLNGPSISKEQIARDIEQRDGIQQGLIAVLSAVEPCWSYNIKSELSGDDQKRLRLISDYRKCQHLYHYQIHPVFGRMHVRLQTWLPFNIHICINGREWLARQMDAAGIAYRRSDNCFTWISDPAAAQALADQHSTFDWTGELTKAALAANPALNQITRGWDINYYWSADESEWATDVMFKDAATLEQLYPALLRHGVESFAGRDVMRFMGRSVPGKIQPQFNGQVVSDLRGNPRFYEGLRLKHRLNHNSIKMYNKAASVLRVETTINDVRDMKSPRIKDGKKVWRPMRKGVVDLPRRAQVSQAANERYLQALSVVNTPQPLKKLTDKLSSRVMYNAKPVRGLNLLGQDAQLLQAISGGELMINGFRNRDLAARLLDSPILSEKDKRRRSGQITRKLRMLRAHGLIRKVPHTHRYQVTEKGRQVIAVLQAAREANIETLSKAA